MGKTDFEAVFAQLCLIMLKSAGETYRAVDKPGSIELFAPWAHPTKPGLQMWFGAVRSGKAYVSYHVMPVYSHPQLLKNMSAALRKHMQGKSCFNFKSLNTDLTDELKALTMEAARLYAKPFTIPPRKKPK